MTQNPIPHDKHISMLSFASLIEALNYRDFCPVCDYKLEINDRDLATDIGYQYRREGRKTISFFVGSNELEVMTIDLHTEEVEITINGRSDWDPSYVVGTQAYSNTILPKTKRSASQYQGGKFLHSLTIDCKRCSQYGYVLQVHVDMGNEKLCGLFLNSEWIAIDENGAKHELKNNYATNKTFYNCYLTDRDYHTDIPLVSINVFDPMETVHRVRKLIIFS